MEFEMPRQGYDSIKTTSIPISEYYSETSTAAAAVSPKQHVVRRLTVFTVIGAVSALAFIVATLRTKDTPGSFHDEEFSNVGDLKSDYQKTPSLSSSRLSSSSETTSCKHCANIVMITLDDVGMNDLGYMSTDIPFATPNIDQMAYAGIRLTNFYGQSLCTPARTTILSGKFTHRTGFATQQGSIEIMPYSNYSIPLEHKLLPQYMQDVGFSTHVIGKWNIGHCSHDYLPWNRGADSFLGYTIAGVNYRTHQGIDNSTYFYNNKQRTLFDMLDGNSEDDWSPAVSLKGVHTTHLFTSRAAQIVQQHSQKNIAAKAALGVGKPLFLWLAYHGAHDDPQSHPEASSNLPEYDLGNESLGFKRLQFVKVLMDLDDSIGSFVMALNATDLLKNTVIIVHSDNGGDPCGDYLVGDNHPLRGSKMTFFEGGVRVPAFVYAPGVIPKSSQGTVYHGLMHHVDWLKTIHTGINGFQVDEYKSDSIDHWAAMLAGDTDSDPYQLRQSIYYSLSEDYAAVRWGDMKIISNMYNSSWYGDKRETANALMCIANNDLMDTSNFLFNITADPFERHNLYYDGNYADILLELQGNIASVVAAEMYRPSRIFSSMPNSGQGNLTETQFHLAGGYVVPWDCETI